MNADVNRSPAMPRSLTFEITSRCNFRCKMCYYTEAHLNAKDDGLSLKDIRRCVDKLPESIRKVYLIGGEPLLRQDIVEITGAFAARGIKPIIITNGYLLDEALVERFRVSGIWPTFEISLDGPPRVHNVIRGRKDAFQRTLANAARVHPEFPVIFTSVLQQENIDTLMELPSRLRDFSGCLHVVQIAREWRRKDHERGQGLQEEPCADANAPSMELRVRIRQDANVSPTVLPRNILFARLRQLEAEGRRHGIRTQIKPGHLFETYSKLFGAKDNRCLGQFRCNQSEAMRLDADGNLIYCYAIRNPVGNLLRQSFGEVWDGKPNRRIRGILGRRLPRLCSQCTAHLDYTPKISVKSLQPLAFGIVGTGRIASVYANVIHSLSDVKLAAVYSRDRHRAKEFVHRHGAQDCHPTASIRELDSRSQAVLVAGQPEDRLVQCRALWDKPLLVEKPLAGTVEAAMALGREDAVSPEINRQNVFPLRHTGWAKTMLDFINGPGNGAIEFVGVYRVNPVPPAYYTERAWRQTPAGSPLWNMLIHEIDLLIHWFGMPHSVGCMGTALKHDIPYDTAFINLHYTDTFRILAAVSTAQEIFPAGRAMLVSGDAAAVHVVGDKLYRIAGNAFCRDRMLETAGDCREQVLALGCHLNTVPESAEILLPDISEDEYELCKTTVETWVERLRMGHAPNPTMLDGGMRVLIVDACHKAMQTGRTVVISDPLLILGSCE